MGLDREKDIDKKMFTEQLGNSLSRIAKDKEVSSQEIAEFLGVTTTTVSKWMSGTTMPSADKAVLLSKYLDVSLGELAGG